MPRATHIIPMHTHLDDIAHSKLFTFLVAAHRVMRALACARSCTDVYESVAASIGLRGPHLYNVYAPLVIASLEAYARATPISAERMC
jgi:hypothetical protein